MSFSTRKYQICVLLTIAVLAISAKKSNDETKPAWAKKKITDYSDADMERLLDQWNVSEDKKM